MKITEQSNKVSLNKVIKLKIISAGKILCSIQGQCLTGYLFKALWSVLL